MNGANLTGDTGDPDTPQPSPASESLVTATALVPVDQLPSAVRLITTALYAWMAEALAPFVGVCFPVTVWRAEHLPEIDDAVLNRLVRTDVVQVLKECYFCFPEAQTHDEMVDPEFAAMVYHVLKSPDGEQAKRIRDAALTCHGVLWLDENGRFRFFAQLAPDDPDLRYLDDSLLLLAALGWQVSRAHLHPLKAPSLFRPLSSARVRLQALTRLDRAGANTVVERVCPELSGTERAQLYAALLCAAKLVKNNAVQATGGSVADLE